MTLKIVEYLGSLVEAIIFVLIVGWGCYLLPGFVAVNDPRMLLLAGAILTLAAELVAKICVVSFVATITFLLSKIEE